MRGSALLYLIVFLLVSPLAHMLKGSELSKFSDRSLSNQISQPNRYVVVATVDGAISLVDKSSRKVDWTFDTNEPIYSSYKAPHYHYNDDGERGPLLSDDFYMDCDKDWNLYKNSIREGNRTKEIVDASEFIGSLPYTLTDRTVLGKKDTTVFFLDGRTGELFTRYRVDDLDTTNPVVRNAKDKAIVLSKDAPVLEHLPEMVYIERKDFKLQCVSKLGDVLWNVSYAEMEAKLQHHESVQLMGGGLSMINATVMRTWRIHSFGETTELETLKNTMSSLRGNS